MTRDSSHARLVEFGEWAAGLQLDDIPASVQRKTKIQIANMLAAASASANSEGNKLTEQLAAVAGSGNCTTIEGKRTDPVTAYFLNSTYSMMHDYDDYCFMGHTCHSAVFTALAICEHEGEDGGELIRATVIANELGGRLGAAASNGPLNGQRWTFIHRAEAAAATTAILGGDGEDIANAVNLAMYDPPYPLMPGFMGSDTKAFSAASPGSDGIRAALFGLSGARGYDEILDDEKGFFEKFAYLPYPEMLTGFGRSWVSESLAYKPHPGCAYLQSPLDCIEEIQAETGIRDDDVESIEIEVGLRTFSMERKSAPYRTDARIPPVNVTFSVPTSVAIMLINGEFTTKHLTEEYLDENLGRIKELEEKMTMIHNPKYTYEAAEGYSDVVDFGALFRDRSDSEIIDSFKESIEASQGYDDLAELTEDSYPQEMPLVVSYHSKLCESSLDWDEFDLELADFEDLSFEFGCSVEVETKSGEVYTANRHRHRGAAGEDIADTETMVNEKLVAEVVQFVDEGTATELVDTISDLENEDLGSLMAPFQA